MVLSVEDPLQYSGIDYRAPASRVVAVEIPGRGRIVSPQFGKSVVEIAVGLPPPIAANVFGSFALHHMHPSWKDMIAHNASCGHNCMMFLAESQGWLPDRREKYREGQEPVLLEQGWSVVDYLINTEPGAPYVLPNRQNRIMHGFVGTNIPDRVLDFHGTAHSAGGGRMRFVPIINATHEYQGVQPHIVRLYGRNYAAFGTAP